MSHKGRVFRFPFAAATLFKVLLSVGLLSGCAPAPQVPVDNAQALWKAHSLALNRVVDWRLLGRFGVQAEGEGYHGRLDWRQTGDALDLTLSGPFSQGGVRMRGGDGSGVELSDDSGNITHADNADALLNKAAGLQMPVTGLRYWVRGLPAPDASTSRENPQLQVDKQVDDRGRLNSLNQHGWNIAYRSYMDVDGLSLPRKVFLERGELRVRLVVERWEL